MISFNGDKKHIRGLSSQIRKVVSTIIKDHKLSLGQIDYNFVDDNTLLEINRSSLNHDYYTDIISFDYTENGLIEGEIYISIDRVIDNAKKYKTEFHVELLRVIFHGVLHYVGYKDKTKNESHIMRQKEEYYIKEFNKQFHVEQRKWKKNTIL